MKTADFDYRLPPELIAQTPLARRDASRLLALERSTGNIQHTEFSALGNFLREGDLLVVNQTRVIPARLFGRKLPGGGKVELLLLNQRDKLTWEVLVGGKGAGVGRRIKLENDLELEVIKELSRGRRVVRFDEELLEGHLRQVGNVPLPPYIHAELSDPERYQTVYANIEGSAAAPTAGLHFTSELIEDLRDKGVGFEKVTLHVGLDTFAPVKVDDPKEHLIHSEWCRMTPENASAINRTIQAGGRIIAVGTTSVRVLETAAARQAEGGELMAFEGNTDLFILPGYEFKLVDVMITNFHLPRSTLLMMVSAFAGRDRVLETYDIAIKEGYRFYSFGDAMIIY